MSITVVTPEHGKITFPEAAYWETQAGRYGDEGNLWIGTAPGEENAIAEFAKGGWLYVYLEEVEDAPRVWVSIMDVPEGVNVEDKDGDLWEALSVADEREFYLKYPERLADGTNVYAPFTEVVA